MGNENYDYHWLEHALKLAQKAEILGEVPIGAVLVLNNEIVGEGWNQSITHNDPSAHAEIVALRDAAKRINNYRLLNSTLYVTIEPCVMCAGALIQARITRLVYGADDPKAGAVKSVFNVLQSNQLNHRVQCESGVLAESCGMLLKNFFKLRREKSKLDVIA